MKFFSFSFLFFLGGGLISSNKFSEKNNFNEQQVSYHSISFFENQHKPNLLLARLKKKLRRAKRVTAAVLAFPLPFGILALHRIYLGTRPYVPIVYIATVGGVLGILPFIDFCVLLLDADPERFNNNHKVFMWIK